MPVSDWSVGGRNSSEIWEIEAVVSWTSKDLARYGG